jgi:hypothetical protein
MASWNGNRGGVSVCKLPQMSSDLREGFNGFRHVGPQTLDQQMYIAMPGDGVSIQQTRDAQERR